MCVLCVFLFVSVIVFTCILSKYATPCCVHSLSKCDPYCDNHCSRWQAFGGRTNAANGDYQDTR
jgi:hypothetical protein